MEDDEGKATPNSQIQQEHKNGLVGSGNCVEESQHRLSHGSVLQDHEPNSEERSQLVLEDKVWEPLVQISKSDITS